MRIGWLADSAPAEDRQNHQTMPGGAKLSNDALLASAPAWAEIVPCPPDNIAPCAAYVIQNCTQYTAAAIPIMAGKPILKCVRDFWMIGDATLRTWLLAHATRVVFLGPPHRDHFKFPVRAPVAYCPPPLDLTLFHAAAQNQTMPRTGVCWLGALWDHKGVGAAERWAAEEQCVVDFYGAGPRQPRPGPFVRYHGFLPYAEVPTMLADYEAFLFLPMLYEPFGRTVVEAQAAGCRLILNDRIGADWWIQHEPLALGEGAARFWRSAAQTFIPTGAT